MPDTSIGTLPIENVDRSIPRWVLRRLSGVNDGLMRLRKERDRRLQTWVLSLRQDNSMPRKLK